MKASEYMRNPIPTRSGPKSAEFFVIVPHKFVLAPKPLGGLLVWKMQEAVPGKGARQTQSRILHPKGQESTSEQRTNLLSKPPRPENPLFQQNQERTFFRPPQTSGQRYCNARYAEHEHQPNAKVACAYGWGEDVRRPP